MRKLVVALVAGTALAPLPALAAEDCECCKDMAADAEMACCDKMKTEPAPAPGPAPVPETPANGAPDGAL